MVAELQPLIDKVWRHCESMGTRGRTVALKMKFADFEITTRSRSVSSAVANSENLAHLGNGLLEDAMPFPKAVRLLGVSLPLCKARAVRSLNWISGFTGSDHSSPLTGRGFS